MKTTIFSVNKIIMLSCIMVCFFINSSRVYAACSDPAGPGVDWSGCVFNNDHVFSASSDNGKLEGLSSNYIILKGANLSNTTFNDVSFDYVDFRGANIANMQLSKGDASQVFYNVKFSTFQLININNPSSDINGFYLVNGNYSKTVSGDGGWGNWQSLTFDKNGQEMIGNIAPVIFSESNYSDLVEGDERYHATSPIQTSGLEDGVSLEDEVNRRRAVDLELDAGHGYISKVTNNPFWQIDFGRILDIKEIRIHTVPDNSQYAERLVGAQVMITDWEKEGQVFGNNPLFQQDYDGIARYTLEGDIDKKEKALYVIKVDRTGQFVRIQLPGNSRTLAFTEVEIITKANAVSNSTPPPVGYEIPVCGSDAGFHYSSLYQQALVVTEGRCGALAEPGVDLSFCDLKSRTLSGVDLSNANLTNADLRGVDLSNTNLSEAILPKANLRGANLRATNFEKASAMHADFRDVSFERTNLNDMSNANACFSSSKPVGVLNWGIKSHEGYPIIRTSRVNGAYGYARQSSNAAGRTARNVVDGDLDTSSLTGEELSPWWVLDMGATYRIDELTIKFADDCTVCSDVNVLISDWNLADNPLRNSQGDQWVQLFENIAASFDGSATQVNIGRSGRYIAIQAPLTELGQLAISSVEMSGSTSPVAPTTFQPLSDADKAQLGKSSVLRDNLGYFSDDLALFKADLKGLSSHSEEARQKTLWMQRIDNRLYKLNKRLAKASQLFKRLQVVKPFKKKAKTLKGMIDITKTGVQNVYNVVHPIENNIVKPVRQGLNSLKNKSNQGVKSASSLSIYVASGRGLLNDALTCSINNDAIDDVKKVALRNFSAAANPVVKTGLVLLGGGSVDALDRYQQDHILETSINLSNALVMDVAVDTTDKLVLALSEQLTLEQLTLLDIELSALEVEFYKFYWPLSSLNAALDTNIDIGIYDFSVSDILDGLGNIPFIKKFEDLAFQLVDPLLARLEALLPSVDLPGISIPDFTGYSLPAVPDFNVKFPDFERADFYQLTLPSIPQCREKTIIPMYPAFFEDLDNDGLINGAEVIECHNRSAGNEACLADGVAYSNVNRSFPFTDTLANKADSDLDGMSDYFEVIYNLSPNAKENDDLSDDPDSDGLSNFDEYLYGTNPNNSDSDNDGLDDKWELEYTVLPDDVDSGITKVFNPNKNNALEDFDNDGVNNLEEYKLGSSPFVADSDNDGMPDLFESLPEGSTSCLKKLSPMNAEDAGGDFDGDQLANILEYQEGTDLCNADTDGDGISDGYEYSYGLNPKSSFDATEDLDGDSLSNLAEYLQGTHANKVDSDNDGINDNIDSFPLDPSESIDSDGDGIGNNTDQDDDNDGVADSSDALPLDATESVDTDSDGIGNNTDKDDDNDGVADTLDIFPLDATESVDTDGDGIGNNADTDDDNDGIIDEDDSEPRNEKVGDTQAPVIGVVNELTFEATSELTEIHIMVPRVTDNNLNASTIVSDLSEPLSLGEHVITWTATDFAGNKTTKEQLVTIVDSTMPVFNEITALDLNAQGYLTDISAHVNISAFDLVDGVVHAGIVGNSRLLSGRHNVSLQASDKSGNVATDKLSLDILPEISVVPAMDVEAGGRYQLAINLSGQAPIYPVEASYQLTKNGYIVSDAIVIISAGTQEQLSFDVPTDIVVTDNLILSLISVSNAFVGNKGQNQLTIIDNNVAPQLDVKIKQNDETVSVVDPDNGLFSIVATVKDINQNDDHDISWTASDNAFVFMTNDSNEFSVDIDPSNLNEGAYSINISVVETNTEEAFLVNRNVQFIIEQLTELANDSDSDNDGIMDAKEGYEDEDGDGIVDYLDNDSNTTRLPTASNSEPMQTSPGLTMSLGSLVKKSQGSSSIFSGMSMDELAEAVGNGAANTEDNHHITITPLYNFIIDGLIQLGDSASVVIPLAAETLLPEGAVYRKYNKVNGWYTFVENENNSVNSALADENGNCPAANDASYRLGLIAGDNCILLIIEDGGFNDADFTINGSVEDPGAVMIEQQNQPPVIDLLTSYEVNEETAVVLDASNTTDAEEDELTYLWQQISGATVALNETTQTKLHFTSPSLSQNELLTFELTVNDDLDSSTIIIQVMVLHINKPPVITINNHNNSYVEGSVVTLTAQASDPDEDVLTYAWEQVSGPYISFDESSSTQVSFVLPDVTSDEVIKVQVKVTDRVLSANSFTSITVVPEKKKGGSMGWLLLVFFATNLMKLYLFKRAA